MLAQAQVQACAESRRIHLVLVSDVRLYREGMTSALGRHATLLVVGTACSSADAVDQVAALDPDVIIVDMATRDSLAAVRTLAAAAPRSKIVAFAVDELASTIASCAEAGIAGYVPCEASVEELAATIESVARDESPCSPRVAAALFRHIATLAGTSRSAPTPAALSRREHEILALIQQGLCNKEIAQKLAIAVATVKNHVHSVLTKLGVTTRAEAAALVPAVRSRIARI